MKFSWCVIASLFLFACQSANDKGWSTQADCASLTMGNVKDDCYGHFIVDIFKSDSSRGMEIMQKGYAEKMFISGVFMPSEIETKFRIEKSKKDLLDCCINFGAKAKNTIENAVEVNQWLSDNSEIIKIILITSYYHLPRSILMFEKKIERNLEVFPVPAVEKVNLLEQPIFHIKLITSEYFKVIYTLLFVK